MRHERRVAVTPETAGKMVADGARALVERGAGADAYFTDDAYAAVGAEPVADAADLFAASDIVLKVKEPSFADSARRDEVAMLKPGQCLVAFLHPASPANHEMVKALASRGVIAFTLDSIPRTSSFQSMDALTSMSTVAGYKAVLMAAGALPVFMPRVSTAAGVIDPARVLVVGAGVAGLQAIATAKRLGAVVSASDIRAEALEHAQSLGAGIVDVGVPGELAVGAGGYARKLPDEWLRKEQEVLKPSVAGSDVVILAALVPGKRAPILLTKEMVHSMKRGSVIVDIAVDQGGNSEATRPGELVEENGVTIHGTQNIPGTVQTSSTWMFANNMYNFVSYVVKDGKIRLDMDDELIASCLVTRDAEIVHAGALEAMGLK